MLTQAQTDLRAFMRSRCGFSMSIPYLYYLRMTHILCISTLYKISTRTFSVLTHFLIFLGCNLHASVLLYRWRRKKSVHIKGLLICGELWWFRKKPQKEALLSLLIPVDGGYCSLIRSSLFSWWQVFEGKSDLQRALWLSLDAETRYEVIICT